MSKKKSSMKTENRRLLISIMLAFIALLSAVGVTVAWFTIADNTRLRSMDMTVTAGVSLRFDLDAHDSFEEYVKTLGFEEIAARMEADNGFDMSVNCLEPVTTTDYSVFTYSDGTGATAESGAYLEFDLHFMATKDMLVHLTSACSEGNSDGTLVSSETKDLPKAMRISFTTGEGIFVYDPGMEPGSENGTGDDLTPVRIFGLPEADGMTYNDDNSLFYMEAGRDYPVTVHIWIEGTDECCTDALRNADYAISMRFEGTDGDNGLLTDYGNED